MGCSVDRSATEVVDTGSIQKAPSEQPLDGLPVRLVPQLAGQLAGEGKKAAVGSSLHSKTYWNPSCSRASSALPLPPDCLCEHSVGIRIRRSSTFASAFLSADGGAWSAAGGGMTASVPTNDDGCCGGEDTVEFAPAAGPV
jgi:hypothetical protein